MAVTNEDLQLISKTIKTLSMDAIQKANSGHPGMPMGCSDIAAVLWAKILKHNPDDPAWINRDRFVLSAGHGSMLLYSMLHLSGYNLTIDDIKNFRQVGSKTPGHPEFGHTEGVETTTGPLGQGFANGIGMSLASSMLGADFNIGDNTIIDHYIYAIAGDGCIMEGITAEAASIAGHIGLGNLIYIYDSNDISIEGDTNLTYSDDVNKRFEACNWHVQQIDGHNFDEIEEAILIARKEKSKPSIIIAKTKIAKGSVNKEGSESSHGAPLGADEIKATKKNIGWDEDASFFVPQKVYDVFEERKKELAVVYTDWKEKFEKALQGDVRAKWDSFFAAPDINSIRAKLPSYENKAATRSAGGKALEVLYQEVPGLLGGSADLGPSNKSFVKGYSESGKNAIGRNIHFGVREHAMGAIQNGIAYYGGFIPFTATFLVFMDYMRPAVRLAALSKLQSIYMYTHDSFFVGEDGPTHQPIEHLAVARAIPGLNVIRPADGEETNEAWLVALARNDGPTMLSLSRQDLPCLERAAGSEASNLSKGAYIIHDTDGTPDILILASGSEVHISIDAAKELQGKGIKARVVSFPCWELFDNQDDAYKQKIIPANIPAAAVEAGLKMGWERYAGKDGLYITIDHFGASGPGNELAEKFGFTAKNIVAKVEEHLK